ncbi:hypothetical protein [Methylobacterium sp. GC_Met_2]|uniref:hypothetical protein n=1 Tax=Methylobacterium sp. GC_Met_2 TaxID=2937376 RepID=UPI00226B7681|nr:hypothetical protein [Methylobacterium sp. GC_Met_2]
MPIYTLKCVLRFTDGRAGAAFDTVEISADSPDEAIGVAQHYECSTAEMALSLAVLTDATGQAVWTLRAPDHVDAASSADDALAPLPGRSLA